MSHLNVNVGDELIVEHAKGERGEVFRRDWPNLRKQAARVWTRKDGPDSGWIDVTGQVDRVVVSEHTIHVDAGAQHVQAEQDKESNPAQGYSRGVVASVG